MRKQIKVASVKQAGATVAFVTNDRGTQSAQTYTYSDGLGEEQTFTLTPARAKLVADAQPKLTAAVERKLGGK